MATGMFENDTSGNCLQQQPPGVPDSPDSIPLPDSPPPETEDRGGEIEDGGDAGTSAAVIPLNQEANPNNNIEEHSLSNISISNSSRVKKGKRPRLAEEYDPSEPLTSSDEEEHSLLLIEGEKGSRNTQDENIKISKDSSSSGINNSSSVLELSSRNTSPKPFRLSTTPPPPSATSKSSSSIIVKPVSPKYTRDQKTSSSSSSSSIITTATNNSLSNEINRGSSSSSSSSSSTRIDLTSIPVPPDENRRPTIHFSIPTRHRLLPISTLIKRQKGSAKKDGKGDGSGPQSESGKGFDKSQDGDDEDEDDEGDENRPKISLVAEIFGNDDEDEENDEETEQTTQQQQQFAESQIKIGEQQQSETAGGMLNSVANSDSQQQPAGVSGVGDIGIDNNSGRWKIVADEPIISISNSIIEPECDSPEPIIEKDVVENNQPLIAPPVQDDENESGNNETVHEDEPEIIEIVTINVPPSNRMRPLRRRPFMVRQGFENGGEPEVIDIDDKEEEEVETDLPPPPRRSSSSRDVSRERERERDRERERERERSERLRPEKPVESSPERERHFKRPHSSSSMSNCEEGEIVDQVNPSKKRKKDRKKKTKRRKRSRDSISPPSKSSEKRLSDILPQHNMSDHEEETGSRGAISWRKPSKRTQNRNYRDGKPKTDDTFFREKEVEEKARSLSPGHRRNRSRKDKSPAKEKSGSKHRREGSPRNRSHSKSPARTSRSRSRSSGRPYRSRRRNRQSRSRSTNSVSDKSRSGRSTSRKRSRKRYRRSTSRHHVGDSRSPSYITEPIRSRSSHYSKLRDRSRSRSRDRHARARYRKRSISRSRSPSPSPRSHKKNRKPESLDRQQRKRQLKEKERQLEGSLSDSKEKKKEKEKLKDKEKRKKKEKPKEEEKPKPKEKVKEKEKKKKKKRREKSPTPVKAIVADGDSIVVSLSFQKGKTASSSNSNAQSSSVTEDKNNENGLDTSTNSESSSGKHSNKTNTENVTANEFNEEAERSQNSPSKLSSVTDEEDTTPPAPCPTERTKSGDEKETEAVKVTSSGGGSCGSNSPFEAERSFSAAADSTKIVTPQQSEQHESSFSHSRSSLSPTDMESNAQGDSLVTSTGDSMEPPANADDDSSKSNSSSTPSKQAESNKLFPGIGNNKIPASQVSPRFQGSQTSTSAATAVSMESNSSSSAPSASTSTIINSNAAPNNTPTTPAMSRPLIGNIPGLYPSSAMINSGGAAPVPPPIVIPTPPPPQGIRFSGGSAPMLNPNVLASVASALLAVRQNQPNLKMPAVGGMNNVDNSSSQMRHMNTLNSRAQTFPGQTNSRTNSSSNFSSQDQGGDSPMSPNSSDGDDLFEPPTDRPQGDGGTNGTGKFGKNGQPFGNAPAHGNNANDSYNAGGGNKPKGAPTLFDSLFGGPDPKKTVANKPEKISKPKAKHRKAGMKKETIKVNTSGGMTEGELRLTDEVPTSAVELIVKQKYLKKLNRQERVVEEVKLSLKPYYSKRHINKDEYKEILRRAVPKICHNKTGEINPGKIKELVEAYVKKFRHARKRGDVSNAK